MASIGVSIQTLAKLLYGRQVPATDDLSAEIIVHLALAYAAAEKLRESGVDLELGGRPLVISSLERAYREIQYIRSRMPGNQLDTTLITRYGRYVGEGKV